jgi:putative flavoprotein involved in K+ transport
MGRGASKPPGERVAPVTLPPAPSVLDLRAEGIRTVIWATGYRRHYPWLALPVLDERGEIRNSGGIVPLPGFYVLGLQFLRRRNSSFIDGVGTDAQAIAGHLSAHLARGRIRAA